jgi:phage terminase large subunit
MRKVGRVWHLLMMDCNPTSPVSWIYQRQARRLLKMYTSLHRDNPAYWDRQTKDWTPEGREYVEGTLKRMTGARRARFYEGKWQAAEGLVYDGFIDRQHDDAETPGHLLPAGWKPPKDWLRVWSIDWGFTSPLVVQFWAVDGDGRMYLYREFYRTGVRAEAVGAWVKEELLLGKEPRPRVVVCDHDPEMKAEFEKGSGLRLELADKKDLIAGIQVVQGRFDKAGDGRPRIFIAEECVQKVDEDLRNAGRPTCFQEELSAYVWDKNSVIERPKDKDNHSCDAGRYACRWVSNHFAATKVQNPYATDYGDPLGNLPRDTFR